MSNRLESLNGKKTPGAGKPSLKFKPKAVARKSKEERAKDAPVVKQEHTGPPTRGRGAMRGGRGGRGGRNNYAGTHLVTSGPLSSGSVSIGNANGSKLGFTSDQTFNSVSPTPEFLQNLKLKSDPTSSPTPGAKSGVDHEQAEDDEDDDPTKINMNKEYRFADEETVLFPFRPARDNETKDVAAAVKSESPEAEEVESTTVSRESTTISRESPVKSEPIEEKLMQIKQHKAEIESKISEPTDLFEREESSKLISDHQDILNLLTDKFEAHNIGQDQTMENDENAPKQADEKYFAFHLPRVLPHYTVASNTSVKDEPQESVNSSQKSRYASEKVTDLKGQIGHINIHQSGKISINLGNNNNLLLAKGNPTNFLQELVMLDVGEPEEGEDVEMMDEEGQKVRGKYVRLGQVTEKLVATPLI